MGTTDEKDVLTTKPDGDGRTSPPDSPALVGPHKGGLPDWAALPLSTWDLLYMLSKSCAVIDSLRFNL